MDNQTLHQNGTKRITAIVPAHNEAKRIGGVLKVLSDYPWFREIIVVDDGSVDATAETVRKFTQVKLVKNNGNHGKGLAMDFGVSRAEGDILFFCDADVIGLTHKIIDDIVLPVLQGEADMSIAMRRRRIYQTMHAVLRIIPLLGGERAVTRELWDKLPSYYKHAFRVESGLNFYANHFGKGFRYRVFDELTQVIKERKYGIWVGTRARMRMCRDILLAHLQFHLVDAPRLRRIQRQTQRRYADRNFPDHL